MKYFKVVKYEAKKVKDYGYIDEATMKEMIRGYRKGEIDGMYVRLGSSSYWMVEFAFEG